MKKVLVLTLCAVLLFGMIFAASSAYAANTYSEAEILDEMAKDWLFTCEQNVKRCEDGLVLYGLGQIQFLSEDAAKEIYLPLKDGLVDMLEGAENVNVKLDFDNIKDALNDGANFAFWDGVEASAKTYCLNLDAEFGTPEYAAQVAANSDIISSIKNKDYIGDITFMDFIKENYAFMLGKLSCDEARECFDNALKEDNLAEKRNWMLVGASLATFGCEMSIENCDEIVKAAYTKEELKFDTEAQVELVGKIAENAVDVIGKLVPEIEIAIDAIEITTDIGLKTLSMSGKLNALSGYMLNPDTIEEDKCAYYQALSNQYGKYTYTISDSQVTMDAYNGYLLVPGETNPEKPDYNKVVVPEKLYGFPVVAFDGTFADGLAITEITIPSTIESRSLSDVVNDCDKLEKVYYNAVNCKGWYLHYFFNNCDSEFEVIFGEDIAVIPERFIANCGLSSIAFPEGVTTIHAGALVNCNNLKTVTIPRTVELFEIPFNEKAIVDNCTNLEKVYYNAISPEADYYNAVFSDCGNDAEEMQLIFGEKVKITPIRFLDNCGVKSVVFPEGMTQVREEAIVDCEKLETITIPSTITQFSENFTADYVFSRCNNLKTVNYNAHNAAGENCIFIFDDIQCDFQIRFGRQIESIPENFISGCGLTGIEFPEGVQTIHYNCLVDCDSLKTVTVPSTVTTIGYNFIEGCAGIETIYFHANCATSPNSAMISDCGDFADPGMTVQLGANVTTVPANFIEHCAITEFIYPEGVKTINEQSLVNCSALEQVVISSTAENLGYKIVSECGRLKTIDYHAVNAEFMGDYAYVFFDSGDADGLEVRFAENIESLPRRFMYDCSVRSVVFPGGITKIPERTVYGCADLKELTIPQNITSIDKYAFGNCTGLTEIYFHAVAMKDLKASNGVFSSAGENGAGITVTIGDRVTKIPAHLFNPHYSASGSPKITHVRFENECICASIGDYAFAACTSLPAFNIPDSVTAMGENVFSDCTGLRSVTIGSGLAELSRYTFSDCTALTSIAIPGSITTIERYAFVDCTGLTTVTMQDSVAEIDSNAFLYCSNLKNVIYCGTENQWNTIDIGGNNETLTDAQRWYHNFENGTCTVCGQIKCASHTWQDGACSVCDQQLKEAIDLNVDGKITAFDAQILAEAMAGLRELTDAQWDALGDLDPSHIVDYILARNHSAR